MVNMLLIVSRLNWLEGKPLQQGVQCTGQSRDVGVGRNC